MQTLIIDLVKAKRYLILLFLLLGTFANRPLLLAQDNIETVSLAEFSVGSVANQFDLTLTLDRPIDDGSPIDVTVQSQKGIATNIEASLISAQASDITRTFTITFDVHEEAKEGSQETLIITPSSSVLLTYDESALRYSFNVIPPEPSGTTQLIYRLVSIEPRYSPENLHGFEHQPNSRGYFKSTTHNGKTTTFSAKLTEFPLEIIAGEPFEIAGEALQRVETVSGWPWCSSLRSPSSGSTMQLSAGTELMHSTGTFMGGRFKGRTDFTIYCSDGTKLRERRGLEHNAPIDSVKKEERMSFRIRYTQSGPPGDVESSLPTGDSNTPVTEKSDPYSFFYSANITSDANTREIPGPEWLMHYIPDEIERERWKNWTAIVMGDLRLVYKPAGTAMEVADFDHPKGSNDDPARKEPEEIGPSETEAQDPETPPGTSPPGIPETTAEPGAPGDPPSTPVDPIAPSNEGGGQTLSPPSESPSPGVPSTTAPPPGSDAKESEPNNSQETATALGLPGFAEGRIDPKGEADWYQVHIDHQGVLQFSTSHVPRFVDLALQVWDSQKRVVKSWLTAPKMGHPLKGEIDLDSPGTYYLEVRDGHNNTASQEIYRLHVLFIPTKDTGEPNDTVETATPLVLEQAIQANILPRNDADWYRLEIPKQGALEVAITDMPSELDVTFQVWGANKKVVHGWRSVQKAGNDHVTGVDLPASGTYYLEVRDGHNNARSSQPYTLRTTLTLTKDTGEPNDTVETATPLVLEQAIQANILPRNDADWYRLEIPKQGALEVAITDMPSELDVTFQVWGANKKVVHGWRSVQKAGNDHVTGVDLPASGTYYLEVRDGHNNARSSQPYTLRTTLTLTKDTGEPNDTVETATPLVLEQAIQANILPRNDADWYRLEIPKQGALEVAITDMPSELDVTFQVWGANKKVVHGWRSVQKAGNDHVTGVDLPASGTYYLEVRDGHNNARSSEPYTLRARLVLQSGQGTGIDRPGRDYRNFPVSSSDECQTACNAEGKCRAWTYVKPGVQGASARCWLKHSVPGPVRNTCCTSGVK